MTTTISCPTCGRHVQLGDGRPAAAPFCSQRCRLADLNGWSEGAFRISRHLRYEDLPATADESGRPSA